MEVDLRELLQARPIIHPTVIRSATLVAGNLTLFLCGYDWWREKTAEKDASYEFHFVEMTEGILDAAMTGQGSGNDIEALEYFLVQSVADAPWAKPVYYQIYCAGPLLSPSALYIVLEKYLTEADSFRQPEYFLKGAESINGHKSLDSFTRIASSNSFLLA